MSTLPQNAVLLVIDVQQGFDDPKLGPRNNPRAESNIVSLLAAWRTTGRPIIHVQHLSTLPDSVFRPGQPGCELKPQVRPWAGETLVTKRVNSAFIGTDLEQRLRAEGVDTLVIVGLTTDHCVSTTTRMAGNLGFQSYLVADATASYDRQGYDGRVWKAEEVHQVSLASLHDEFTTVVTTEQVLDMVRTRKRSASTE